MTKLLILEFDGDFKTGFRVRLEVRDSLQGMPRKIKKGQLPPNLDLFTIYRQWQLRYSSLENLFRALTHSDPQQITHSSDRADAFAACQDTAAQVERKLDQWLLSPEFAELRQNILVEGQQFYLWIRTDQVELQRLPWEKSALAQSTEAMVALAMNQYSTVPRPKRAGGKIRILAVLGYATDLKHLADDKQVLKKIAGQAGAEIVWLESPTKQQLNQQLRQQRWDVLFFSGHSASSGDGKRFEIQLTESEHLEIPGFRYALRDATQNGLHLAIFNSCDGIGLAHQLAAEEGIALPHLIFMREKLPDPVSPKFLQVFLEQFTDNASLYQSVQKAQEQLHDDWEDTYPCASSLPVICPNPLEPPPNWRSLKPDPKRVLFRRLFAAVGIGLAVAAGVIGIRNQGMMEPIELRMQDQLFQLKPKETFDDRLAIITIDQEDMDFQDQQGLERSIIEGTKRKRSLSGKALSQLLTKLKGYQPRVIGLDILRPIAASVDYPPLAQQLRQTPNLVVICTPNNPAYEFQGFAPPPEIPLQQVGFSDVPLDDYELGLVRRYLYQGKFSSNSPCLSPSSLKAARNHSSGLVRACRPKDFAFSFGLLMALQYLDSLDRSLDCQALQKGVLDAHVKDVKLGDRLQLATGPYRTQRSEVLGARQFMLNFRRLSDQPQQAITKISKQKSLREVLSPEFDGEEWVKGKIVLIGVTESGIDDFYTPFGQAPEDAVPGVYLHAHAISQILSSILEERPSITYLPEWLDVMWITVWSIAGAVGILVISYRRIILSLLAAMILGSGIYGVLLLYSMGLWVPVIPAGVAFLVSATVASVGLILQYADEHPYSWVRRWKPNTLEIERRTHR